MSGPTIKTGVPQQTQQTNRPAGPQVAKTRSLAVDGQSIASQQLQKRGDTQTSGLAKGLYSLPEHVDPDNAKELVARSGSLVSQTITNDEETGKKMLDISSAGMLSQFAGSGGVDDLSAQESIANAIAGIGEVPFDVKDKAQKTIQEASRRLEQLDTKLRQGETIEHQNLVAGQTSAMATHVSAQETAAAASALKMDHDPGLDPNSAHFPQLFALTAKMAGGDVNQMLFRVMKFKENTALNKDVSAMTSKLGPSSFNIGAANMLGRGGGPVGGGKGGSNIAE